MNKIEQIDVTRYGGDSSNRLELSNIEFTDNDRAYIKINDLFDLRIVKTDEGIVVDIFAQDEGVSDEPLATTYVYDNEAINFEEEEYEITEGNSNTRK